MFSILGSDSRVRTSAWGRGCTSVDKSGQGGGWSILADILRTSCMDDPLYNVHTCENSDVMMTYMSFRVSVYSRQCEWSCELFARIICVRVKRPLHARFDCRRLVMSG